MGHHRDYYRWFNLRSKRNIQWPNLQMPTFGENSLFLQLDLQGALQPAILPIVFCF